MALILTLAGDTPAFPAALAVPRVPRAVGRPRTTPAVVPADKAYESRAIRDHLRLRSIRAVLPTPPDQRNNRNRLGSPGGRAPSSDSSAR
jgi:hypothetical protein